MASNQSTGIQPASMDIETHVNGGLDPARTALVLVHMVKRVAGDVGTLFNQLFRRRAEENGIIEVQERLLRAFRAAEVKVLYTAVNYKQGPPGVRPISPLWRACSTMSA
jgi:nicotinamidase-related amidase